VRRPVSSWFSLDDMSVVSAFTAWYDTLQEIGYFIVSCVRVCVLELGRYDSVHSFQMFKVAR